MGFHKSLPPCLLHCSGFQTPPLPLWGPSLQGWWGSEPMARVRAPGSHLHLGQPGPMIRTQSALHGCPVPGLKQINITYKIVLIILKLLRKEISRPRQFHWKILPNIQRRVNSIKHSTKRRELLTHFMRLALPRDHTRKHKKELQISIFHELRHKILNKILAN